MIRRVYEQPQELVGHEYGPGIYEWFEFFTDSQGTYAVVGLCLDHPQEAWMYWRITAPSVAAWRDLAKTVGPEIRRYCKARGKSRVVVQTADERDTHWEKLMHLMGFNQRRVVKTAWQEL